MSVHRVPPKEAHKLMTDEGYAYLDVRTEQEWQGGHVPGSYNIPYLLRDPARGMALNERFLEVCQSVFDKSARLVVGCQSGKRSHQAVQALQQAGFEHVVDVRGGFGGEGDMSGRVVTPGWAAEGLPTTRECPPQQSYRALGTPKT